MDNFLTLEPEVTPINLSIDLNNGWNVILFLHYTIVYLVPIFIIFFSEAQNTTYRQFLKYSKSESYCGPLLAYFITNSTITVIAGVIGWLIYLTVYSLGIVWVLYLVVITLGCLALVMFLNFKGLWKRQVDRGEPLMPSTDFCTMFCRGVVDILKVMHVEVTHKIVMLLSTYIIWEVIVIEGILAYAFLSFLGVVANERFTHNQRGYQTITGILLVLYAVPSYYVIGFDTSYAFARL